MEKKPAKKEESLSPYQQSIQKFTEQIMDIPGDTSDKPEERNEVNKTPEEIKVPIHPPTPLTGVEIKTYFVIKNR